MLGMNKISRTYLFMRLVLRVPTVQKISLKQMEELGERYNLKP